MTSSCLSEEVNISNDSYVDVDDISNVTAINNVEGSPGVLLCHTNKGDHCSRRQTNTYFLGEWYLPNGTFAGIFGGTNRGSDGIKAGNFFFARNRGPSVVRLFRGGTPSERGRFRCEVPNADNVNKILYANICEFI